MWRIIEILKYLQYSCTVNINFLTNKFNITSRTLQRDIVFINSALIKISSCKILRKQNEFIIRGDDKDKILNLLLAQFIHIANQTSFVKMSNLFLTCVWQKSYLTTEKIINITNTTEYNLKKDIIILNNFLVKQNLKLTLHFVKNKGFKLIGYEQHLRFITAIIISKLSNSYNSLPFSKDKTLTYIYQTIKSLIINSGYKISYNEQLVWFLAVAVRRIKINFLVEDDNFLEIPINFMVKEEINKLILLIGEELKIKLNTFEINYFMLVILFNSKITTILFPEIMILIDKLTNKIFSFILNKYQISLSVVIFKKILHDFLIDNWFKMVFGCYNNVSFELEDTFELESTYQWGEQLVLIINRQLKDNNFLNINLVKTKYLIMAFNKSFHVNENWTVSLAILSIDDSFISNEINTFIGANFPNILLIHLKSDLNNIFKFYILNQKPTILFKKHNFYHEYNLCQYKNIVILNIYEKAWNYQLEKNINEKIKLVMLKNIQQSIIVFRFYQQEKFYSLNLLLWKCQKILMRKYQLDQELLDANQYSVIKTYANEKILFVNQLIPYPNYKFPVILIYIKNPLIFQTKFKIHFVFISFTNKNNTQNYFWIKLWISLFKIAFPNDIKSIKEIYQIINLVSKN